MATANNSTMHRAGFANAARVARALSKSVSWVHRSAAAGEFRSMRDGSMLYIDTQSLIDYFARKNQTVYLKAARELRNEVLLKP